MTKTETGGAAFPHCFEDAEGHPRYRQSTGLSIRDWFAGQALMGRMARNSQYRTWDDAAADAYEIADAMLRARGGTNAK